jgi:hypothetical protein
MRKISLTLLAAAGACVVLASCNREIKPKTKGCFIVSGKKLVEIAAVNMETVFTPEGFALNYFNGEPSAYLRTGDYIILYGDYKPTALKPYKLENGYYQEDSGKPAASDAITVGPMKGETDMFKIRFTRDLPSGVYLLECQQGNASVGFPFRVD